MNKKILLFVLPILALALVSAVVMYYVQYRVTINVNQPITFTGIGEHEVDCSAGETCVDEQTLTISNSDDEDRMVTITAVDYSGDISTGFVGKVLLSEKNEEWQISEEPEQAQVYYTMIGDKFVYRVESDLEDYVLVYYPDVSENREWNINNAILIGDAVNEWNVRDLSSIPLDMDWNKNPSPDYCDFNNELDDYLHCSGAKFWLMPKGDWNTKTWNPTEYLFETDLISYSDNIDGTLEVLVPAEGNVEAYLQITVDKYAVGGSYPVDITIA